MYTDFIDKLENADFIHDNVIAVCIDIRGFTRFCNTDMANVVAYMKLFYQKLFSEYFTKTKFHIPFYKPTGDGVMIIISCNQFGDYKLKNTINEVIKTSLDFIAAFPYLCRNSTLINFDVPKKIGIGLARGNALALLARNQIIGKCIKTHNGYFVQLKQHEDDADYEDETIDECLDYYGSPLNEAARWVDIARPYGLIFDENFVKDEDLSQDIRIKFANRTKGVFVDGIAEQLMRQIYYQEHTKFDDSLFKPIERRTIPVDDINNAE
ncbi:MAG: hypothetical protein P9M15_04010 [Candidatus Electryoneaceae bacterium]|nr:hypothetical protein [Candidatus Electryoneaceae bacterium]